MKLTTGEQNLLNTFIPNWQEIDNTDKTIERHNRFGFGQATVTPLVAVLVEVVFNLLEAYETNSTRQVNQLYPAANIKSVAKAVQLFDRTKYLVLKLDQQAYSTLID